MIIHIPHSSRLIPAEYRSQFTLSDEQLHQEINVMTDLFTDKLFEFDSTKEPAVRIVFPVNRLLVDPERFSDDEIEPMSKKGMGVLYSRMHRGEPMRRDLELTERSALLEKYYFSHQKLVSDAVGEELAEYGSSLVIDGHSFPSNPLPCHYYAKEPSPDFCIGTDSFHTPDELAKTIEEKIKELGYTVETNIPFAGAFVPSDYYGRDKRVSALMIEVNRRLYMDETSAEKLEGFQRIQAHVKQLLVEAQKWLINSK
jgi:N-formylglutamate amidohydrolase